MPAAWSAGSLLHQFAYLPICLLHATLSRCTTPGCMPAAQAIAARMPQLAVLKVNTCVDPGLLGGLAPCQQLRSLVLKGTSVSLSAADWAVMARLTSLELLCPAVDMAKQMQVPGSRIVDGALPAPCLSSCAALCY